MRHVVRLLFAVCVGVLTTAASAADNQLAQAQLNLTLLGYDAGPADGSWGAKTKSAFEQFYAERSTTFDGKFSGNDVYELYLALSEVPFNGAGMDGFLSAKDGKTTENAAFDFVPNEDLAAEMPQVKEIVPFDHFAARIRAANPIDRENICGFPPDREIPDISGKTLTTYPSLEYFNTVANRVPHKDNVWFDDAKWLVSAAASHSAGNRDPDMLRRLHDFFLTSAKAGAGLDSVHLLDKAEGRVIVQADFQTALMASTGLTLSYLLVKPRLRFSADEGAVVEQWLDRLFETFADSFVALTGASTKKDPRAVGSLGKALMAHAMLKGDAEEFNLGARFSATFISFVREDGSHRFGVSRGFRALYYQGVSFDMALEMLLIMESQGLPARELLLPTISRMATFIDRASKDNSVLWPYAKENVSVSTGSDYKKQDKFEAPNALDMFFALSPEDPSVEGLREVRKINPYDTQITESFAGTCMALGFGSPADSFEQAEKAKADSTPALTNSIATVGQGDKGKGFLSFRVSVTGKVGKRAIGGTFDVLTDYDGRSATPDNLDLLRIAVNTSSFADPQSAVADYSDCGEMAVRKTGPNLHYGKEESYNQCVFDHMGPKDVEKWKIIFEELPRLVHESAVKFGGQAAKLDELMQTRPLRLLNDYL